MLDENVFKCTECEQILDESLRQPGTHFTICEECYSELYIRCTHCDAEIPSNESEGNDCTILCNNCYFDYYTRCYDCNRLLLNEDAYYVNEDGDYPYCYNCYDEINEKEASSSIHEYSYKPDPLFHGDEGFFMGIEIEIDIGGCDSDNASNILDIANDTDERIYIKRDSSIDDGFEIVSHPLTYNYHLNSMPWKSVLQYCASRGYRSHQTSTCGLHIHIGRSGLGEDECEQEETISKILYFVEKHWDQILKFSRRTQDQIDRWARRYGYKDCPKEMLDYAKELPNGRYSAINLLNSATIEFRLFRGTLKYKTFIATLQLVDEICKIAKSLSDDCIQILSWQTFVASISDKPELVEYLKIRSLYINEPFDDKGVEL